MAFKKKKKKRGREEGWSYEEGREKGGKWQNIIFKVLDLPFYPLFVQECLINEIMSGVFSCH